jgi:hypothetical protein
VKSGAGGTFGVVTSVVATPEADPIFDVLAQAALDRGFREDQIAVGSSDELPGAYILNLQSLGQFAEMAIHPQVLEDAMFDAAGATVDRLADVLKPKLKQPPA